VACNKFPHVKVAHNTKKVGQAWSRSPATATQVQVLGSQQRLHRVNC